MFRRAAATPTAFGAGTIARRHRLVSMQTAVAPTLTWNRFRFMCSCRRRRLEQQPKRRVRSTTSSNIALSNERQLNSFSLCVSRYSDDDAFAPEHFPYFTHHVKDLYFKFVEQVRVFYIHRCHNVSLLICRIGSIRFVYNVGRGAMQGEVPRRVLLDAHDLLALVRIQVARLALFSQQRFVSFFVCLIDCFVSFRFLFSDVDECETDEMMLMSRMVLDDSIVLLWVSYSRCFVSYRNETYSMQTQSQMRAFLC